MEYMEKLHRRRVRDAKRARRELKAAIKRVDAAKVKGRPGVFRCIEWPSDYFCTGRMEVRRHAKKCPVYQGEPCDCAVKSRTFVGAHHLPAFAQCSGCGYAPGDIEQAVLLGRMLAKA